MAKKAIPFCFDPRSMTNFFPELDATAKKTIWTGLNGSSATFALAWILVKLKRPTIVVYPRDSDAKETIGDLEFFLQLISSDFHFRIFHYPARTTDLESTYLLEPQVSMQRLDVLHQLLEMPSPVCVVTSFQALAQITLPKKLMLALTNLFIPGCEIDREQVLNDLLIAGYERESLVTERGSFAIRGSILDVYPHHLLKPRRIEFMGDTIESIREFDPTTQRSLSILNELVWIPCRELILNEDTIKEASTRLKTLADDRNLPPKARLELEQAILDRRYMPALEPLLPIFYSQPSTIFDYARPRPDVQWIVMDPFALQREKEQLAKEFEQRDLELEKSKTLACSPSQLSISLNQTYKKLSDLVSIELSDVTLENQTQETQVQQFSVSLNSHIHDALLAQRKSDSPLAPLISVIRNGKDLGLRIILVAGNESGAHRLHSILSHHIDGITIKGAPSPQILDDSDGTLMIVQGTLSSGFCFDAAFLFFITESEIFGAKKHADSKEIPREDLLSSLSELNPGDAIVHIDHGVAIYRGLERLTLRNVANDFLLLEYAEGDKLYLPIYRLNRIHKYIGANSQTPEVDRLGNQSAWNRLRDQAQKAIAQMAQELIELYAQRKVAKGYPLSRPDETYLTFEADFPFEETRDQLKTLEEVSNDLESEKPMDRLVCGDVGFGKTEVALRASFRIAMSGKQVAVLVPTTVLTQQHYETFCKRFTPYPVRIDFLSRFKSSIEQKNTIAQLKEGTLDIVIGTHRLLSKDVSFKDLGLLIVDEEHRFGVKAKEQIKQYRNRIHVLTLTATPIPRTLQLSMAGIRNLSVINTPPLDRKAVQTFLVKNQDSLIRNVILKELSRDGQVFFVHNRVETIHAMQSHLRALVPEAKIETAHGQMLEKDLENAMYRFLAKEFNVLLCTTIIESGLDISCANTILINRADTFGLAQLYQLRGRVGRSDRSAYAYLLIPGEEIISRDALKRLKVLKRFTELGSGLKIALHDLEIRGAGNLLGASQSGHIAAIGFELYTQLLEREVRRLKGEEVKEEIEPEIQCHIPAYIPEDYVADTHERLLLYKRLSGAKSVEELNALREEMVDRFGPLTPTIQNLLELVDLKVVAQQRGVAILRLSGERPSIEFTDQAQVDINKLLNLIKKDKRISLRPDNRLMITLDEQSDLLTETKKILLALN